MESNLTTHYDAIQTDRVRLSAQAERGWLADLVAADQQRPRGISMRRWLGGIMIYAGERIQGMPRPAFVEMQPGR